MIENPRAAAGDLRTWLHRTVWEVDLATLPRWRAILIGIVRFCHAVIRSIILDQLTLRAMSLVYTTLLSLVPLLAISFSVLKGMGLHNRIEPFLLNLLAPLGDQSGEIVEMIIGFVENIKVGVLGFLGFALLFYTVIALMQKIERTFNHIWHITRERSLGQQVRDYLVVILIGPITVIAAAGITVSMMNTSVVQWITDIQPFGFLIETIIKVAPYFMIVGAFTFIYLFVPNTRVRLGPALVGGIVAGFLWHAVGKFFASFVAGSAQYTAIYSTFASLMVLLIWLYLGWLILLTGASIAFHCQHPEYVTATRREMTLSNRVREKLALLIAYLIGSSFYRDQPGWTADALAQRLSAPMFAVERVLVALEAQHLLARTSTEPPAYLPARPMEITTIADVLHAVRIAEETPYLNPDRLPHEPAVDDIIHETNDAANAALRGRTLKDLALGAPDSCSAIKSKPDEITD